MNAAQLAQVYGFIVDRMLGDNYLHESDRLAAEWHTSVYELLTFGVRTVPSVVRNAFIGSECLARFGAEVLQTIPGFIRFSRPPSLCDCVNFDQPCWCDGESWSLDLDPQLYPHGLLIPETDHLGRAIALRVFRNSKDQNGFLLRSRRREIAA